MSPRETEAGPSGPAAVGSCTYFGDRPAISAASSPSIAGRYSPLPTSATGPGLATLVRIQAVRDDRSPSSGHGSPIDLGSAFCSPRWSSWRHVGPLILQLPQYPRLRGGGGGEYRPACSAGSPPRRSWRGRLLLAAALGPPPMPVPATSHRRGRDAR